MCACSCWDTVFKGNFKSICPSIFFLSLQLSLSSSVFLSYLSFQLYSCLFLFYCSSGFEIGSINLSTKTCARVLVGIRYSKVILSLHVLLYLFLSLYICLSLVLYFCLICHSSSLSSCSVFLFYCSSGFEIGSINQSTKICACVRVRILSSKVIFYVYMSFNLAVSMPVCLSLCPSFFESICLLFFYHFVILL